MSLKWRIAGALALIAALVSVIGVVSSYSSTRSELTSNLDSSLRESARRIARGDVVPDESSRADRDDDEEFDDEEHDDDDEHDENHDENDAVTPTPVSPTDTCPLALLAPIDAAQLISPDGAVTACFSGSPDLPVDEEDLEIAGGENETRLHTVSTSNGRFREITVRWGDRGAIQAGRSLDEVDEVLNGLLLRLGLAGAAAVLVAGLLGYVIAARIVRPVRRLNNVAADIASTRDLTIPVPASGSGEVGELARSFQTMTAALSTSLEQQQRLVTDASHELRTPLTALRTNIETLEMFDAIPAAERSTMIADVRRELDELTNLVSELVDLATDRQNSDEAPTVVDLSEVATRVARRAERRHSRTVEVRNLRGGAVEGHSAMLERAIGNLVENAIKYSPDGGTVTIEVDGGSVRVRDRGPGIPADDLPHVFERFYRSIDARSTPGSGLGLSIVADAVERHGGKVYAANSPDGGAIVGFDIPV